MTDGGWSAQSSGQETSHRESKFKKEEEPSGDRALVDQIAKFLRHSSARASLRVAFAMSFAEDSHSKSQNETEMDDPRERGAYF